MGSYLDTSWADLRALTREKRAARRPEPMRFSVAEAGAEFVAVVSRIKPRRRKRAAARWLADQWASGVHHCGYCGCGLSRLPNRLNCATVDHREPWLGGAGGPDHPCNWLVACLECNRLKGPMREAEFRALLVAQRPPSQSAHP